jgi:hypothetical protein
MRRRIQLSVDGDWLPDYPAPSSYLPSFFGCHGGHNRKHYVCDPELDRQMQQASAVELQDPTRAAALWTKVDHELVDRAFWVPTVNVRNVEFVSTRLRNYQFNETGPFPSGRCLHSVLGRYAMREWCESGLSQPVGARLGLRKTLKSWTPRRRSAERPHATVVLPVGGRQACRLVVITELSPGHRSGPSAPVPPHGPVPRGRG